MAAERKERWRKEINWLLSVTDHIVEFVPSNQTSKDGTILEIMVTKQRADLQMNIPALRKLDSMLIDCLDTFKDQNEFFYDNTSAKDDAGGGVHKGKNSRKDDKWWKLELATCIFTQVKRISRKTWFVLPLLFETINYAHGYFCNEYSVLGLRVHVFPYVTHD
ncbi:unnamed protein product [Cuscuta epithymum]|uniref:PRONE domain-containing protein n=1 Tax=Cuscuta epithymum TaxID=186058 RepID=A0AAV0EJ94_9ASTE|nr:unnamed protein product [Cuscuta epithymum]